MSELILYNEESYTRAEHSSCDHLQSKLAGHIAWLNLEGTDTPHFAEIQEFLHLHPLLVEDLKRVIRDILNVVQQVLLVK